MAKKRSSSRAWLREHREDPYVQRALKEGYRSRACYKLQEINERDRLIRPGMTVLDLGSAPGGWSQVAAELVGGSGRVIASDLLQGSVNSWFDADLEEVLIQGNAVAQSMSEYVEHATLRDAALAKNAVARLDLDRPDVVAEVTQGRDPAQLHER